MAVGGTGDGATIVGAALGVAEPESRGGAASSTYPMAMLTMTTRLSTYMPIWPSFRRGLRLPLGRVLLILGTVYAREAVVANTDGAAPL